MLTINNLSINFGNKDFWIKNTSFSVKNGEILTILGSSWSGKTTLLKWLSWYIDINNGEIIINELNIENLDISKRGIVLALQEYLLYPNLSIYKNIETALSQDSNYSVWELLDIFWIKNLSKRYPHEISWWEQQRISIARAIASSPKVLLLDEPFSNLDTITKHKLKTDLKNILKKLNIPIILVSHDKSDAYFFSENVLILQNGEQVAYWNIENVINETDNKYVAWLLSEIIELSNEDKEYLNITITKDFIYIKDIIFNIDNNWNFSVIESYYNGFVYENICINEYDIKMKFYSDKKITFNQKVNLIFW